MPGINKKHNSGKAENFIRRNLNQDEKINFKSEFYEKLVAKYGKNLEKGNCFLPFIPIALLHWPEVQDWLYELLH